MSFLARLTPRAWVLVPLCALGFLAWSDHVRIERVEAVSHLQGRDRPVDAVDPRSPTGYANGQRELIVPEDSKNSLHWILQTQLMFSRRQARVRHVDYENAPGGHDLNAASPFRWWLGLVACAEHRRSGLPIGFCVERAALYAGPLLLLLLVAAGSALVAWQYGGLSAALFSLGLAALFPFASGFLPGVPDERDLAWSCALLSVLFLLTGTRNRGGEGQGKSVRRRGSLPWFALSGVAGGLGLWVSVQVLVPVVAGLALGIVFAAWVRRRTLSGPTLVAESAPPLRVWAASGGATVLLACCAEYFPSHMGSLNIEAVHPAYGLAWIGLGELLVLAVLRIQGGAVASRRREAAVALLGTLAVASVPALMAAGSSWGFLVQPPNWPRLTLLPGGPAASSTGMWLVNTGLTPWVLATLLPVATWMAAAALLFRPTVPSEARTALAVAMGPLAVTAAFACFQLSWWSVWDAALLPLWVVAAAEGRSLGRMFFGGAGVAVAVLGLVPLAPRMASGGALKPTAPESEQLVERHLGHWLARRAGGPGAIVYAPPNESTGLCYYGGLHGIGSFAPDNRAGFAAALNIAAAPSMEEAQSDLQARGVRYLVIPSWDPFFDEFARRYLDKRFADRPNFFVGELRRWNLPLWLRPIPYQMPVSGPSQDQSVLVFEVVDEQTPALAASRLAEYLVEMGDLEKAAEVGESLKRYPGDLGAQAARLQVLVARGDAEAAARVLASVVSRVSAGGDRYLPLDRRVSLSIVMAQAGRIDLARAQTRRCFREATEAGLRSLTTGSLYNLLVIGGALHLEIQDAGLRATAIDLLPEDLRSRL